MKCTAGTVAVIPASRQTTGRGRSLQLSAMPPLGVPRNPSIAANADPAFFDMGPCGPKRTDLTARTDLYGKFKIPTLRNIELTAPFGLQPGDPPRLTAADTADLVAFLRTLTDDQTASQASARVIKP